MRQRTVIVKLKGGLGNQMFQYAYGRCLSLRHKTIFKLDKFLFRSQICQKMAGITPRKYELGEFNIVGKIAGFKEIVIKNKNNIYLDGYFQSEKYFKDIRQILLKEFTLRKKTSNFSRLERQISESNSVSVHIRRGDYVKDIVTRKYHGVQTLGYYLQAMKIIEGKIKKPHFFFFSDDILWVKENFNKVNNPVTFVSNLHRLTNQEELILMSFCKHNIIANSSFSWWGAWLNINPKKIVVAPKRWFRQKVNEKSIVPREWIRI
jgi:hypothetical protein